ncbi:MAG: allophanate hydrolase subunit 1 [Candidatus Eremiobacteraeota bacterium]|nr:allophanate hydrolase subunit 1 [Candidatus Eremiobacteraeota bacterium]
MRQLGDAAIIATLGDDLDPTTVACARSLYGRVREEPPRGVVDAVPAYASVLVRFDPEVASPQDVMIAVRAAAAGKLLQRTSRTGLISVSVFFGGDEGPDLESSAAMLEMEPRELVRRFCGATYEVAFLGFLAGFPYMIGLPQELKLQRHATPRAEVASGSVAIAGPQCGIYPRAAPGGWRILGRTDAVLFDPFRGRAALFAPGDIVRFVASQSRA